MSANIQGPVNDLALATEFIMGAIRDLVAGKPPDHPSVREQIEWAMRKMKALQTIPAMAHSPRNEGGTTLRPQ